MVISIPGKKFTIRGIPDNMLAKLSDGLNSHYEVIIKSTDDGYTVVFTKGIIDKIDWV